MSDRAVVAISEDRQWLVVRFVGGFMVFGIDISFGIDGYSVCGAVDDTGQDAHDVLREFLEGRK